MASPIFACEFSNGRAESHTESVSRKGQKFQGPFFTLLFVPCDLRKFSEYARIIGYKDNKRHKPDKLISFNIPRGWIVEYFLHEKAVLPHGADRKLRDAMYLIDDERPIPPEVKEAADQALYWEIIEFRSSYAAKPVR